MYEESALHSRALSYVVYSGSAVRYPGRCLMKYIDHNSEYIGDYFNISAVGQGISICRQSKTKEIPHIPPATFYTKRERPEVRQRY